MPYRHRALPIINACLTGFTRKKIPLTTGQRDNLYR